MDDIKTFSLSKHSPLFSLPENGKEYLFVGSGDYPYHEEPYRPESYAIAYIKEGGVRLHPLKARNFLCQSSENLLFTNFLLLFYIMKCHRTGFENYRIN